VVKDHALCRHCGHVVRVDWEICFHCGVRRPVPLSLSMVGFRLTTDLLLCCLVLAAALNIAAVWNVVRGVPARLAVEVATTARAVAVPAGEALRAPPLRAARMPVILASASCVPSASAGGVTGADGGTIALRGPAAPSTALAIMATPFNAACGQAASSAIVRTSQLDLMAGARLSGAAAGTRLVDAVVTARAIAASQSLAELDRLESQLRADHPDDPTLRPGGPVHRQLAARRAALAARR
jgi:hypothetical protein